MANIGWEHFEHIADIGIRGKGKTKAHALEQIAIAMTAVITELENINPEIKVKIHCQADDDDTLLYDFLNAIIYEMDTRKMLFSKFEVSLEQGTLEAILSGQAVDREIHQPVVEIKGATYTDLSFKQSDEGIWIASCVIDV